MNCQFQDIVFVKSKIIFDTAEGAWFEPVQIESKRAVQFLEEGPHELIVFVARRLLGDQELL